MPDRTLRYMRHTIVVLKFFLKYSMPVNRQFGTAHEICHIDHYVITFAYLDSRSWQLPIYDLRRTFDTVSKYALTVAAESIGHIGSAQSACPLKTLKMHYLSIPSELKENRTN